jgi:hypothetical protein
MMASDSSIGEALAPLLFAALLAVSELIYPRRTNFLAWQEMLPFRAINPTQKFD